MATGVELGTAYLSLVASTSGLAPSVRKGMGAVEKEADAAGKKSGKKFSGGIGGAIRSGAKSLVAPIGAALATVGVTKFFSDAVASASDFQEAGTKIEAIFGKGGGAVQDYAKNAAKNIGQSTNAALDAAGTFGVFGKSAGLSGKDLAKFSTDFVGLSTDLASFNNTSPEQAVEAIGAALRGESEPMRQYGVLLDDATLRNRALKLGLIETTKDALTPQQKVLAAQAEIYAQTKDAQGDFAKTSGGLANQQRILKAQFEDVKTQVGQFLLPIINKLALVFTEKVMPAIRDFIQGWKDGSGAGGRFRDVLERVGSALKGVGGFLAEHKTSVVALIGAYAGFKVVAATMRAYRAVMLAVRAAQAGYTAASYGAAAATYAQGKAGKAGLIVGKLFNSVVRAGSAVQRGFAAAALGTRIQLAALAAQEKVSAAIARLSLGTRLQLAALWVREKAAMVAHRVALIASTVATKAATLATKALNLVMKANPIGLIITAIGLLVGALVWFFTKTKLGKKIIAAAWSGIKSAIKGVSDWWTKTAWPAIKKAIDLMKLGFKVAKEKISNAWTGIKDAAKTAWNWVRDNVFAKIRTGLSLIRAAFKLAKEKVTGAWGSIKSGLASGWNWIRDNVFGKLKSGLRSVREAFKTARDKIGDIWAKIKTLAMKPVKFVVDTIYNKGIAAFVNKVFGWLGSKKKLGMIDTSGWATGGWTGPGSKYQPAGIVHADEFVVKKSSRRKFERDNPGALDHINRTGRMPGYAGGGIVAAANWWRRLGAVASEHPAFGGVTAGAHMNGSQHYSGNAVDLNKGAGTSLAEQSFFDKHLSAFRMAFPNMHVLWRVADHFNHMHIDTSGGGSRIGRGGNFGSSGFFDIIGKLRGLKEKMSGELFASPLGGALKGLGKAAINGPIKWIKDQLAKFGDDGKGHAVAPMGNTAIRQQVQKVAEKYGWGFGPQWNALDWIINKESGWNPNAKNPSSSARGLFQKMTSIHGALESSVAGQAKWGLGYIKSRYGNPLGAQAFHQSHGYYANGGRVLPKLYDQGGWLPRGLSVVENRTSKPERILNEDQWNKVQGAGSGVHIDQLVTADPRAAVREIERMERRRAIRLGMAGG